MKTLFILASMMVVVFLAAPDRIDAQRRKVAAKTIEGVISGHDGTRYWSGYKIESNGKEYTFVTEYNSGQGKNPKIIGGECCEIGARVKLTYIGSITAVLAECDASRHP